MPDEQVRIDIVADDKASKVIDKVADAAGDLEQVDATVTAKADTDDALHGLADVKGEANELDGSDATITAKLTNETTGPFADIFADLDRLQTEAKQTGDKLDSVTGGDDRARLTARGNAISDLTGPLGDVSSQASDVAGVFDGFSDILEGLGPKFGVSAEQMVGAIGGIGFAVTAAVTAWGYYTQKQEEARRKAEELAKSQKKINDAVDARKFRDAAEELVTAYSDAYDAAHNLGITSEELTSALMGQSDITDILAQSLTALQANTTAGTTEADFAKQAWDGYSNTILEAIGNVDTANQSLTSQSSIVDQVTAALRKGAKSTDDLASSQRDAADAVDDTKGALDRLRGGLDFEQALLNWQTNWWNAMAQVNAGTALTKQQVLDLKQSYLDLATATGQNPVIIESTLKSLDDGDYARVQRQAENAAALNPIKLAAVLALRPGAGYGQAAGTGPVPTSVWVPVSGGPTPTTTVNVTQHLPRGWRGDALTEARRAAHRSGGLYNRVRR